MNAADFELNVWISAEPKYAMTMRDLAAHAARYAGCRPEQADRYAATVERAVGACLARARGDELVPVVLRRDGGPLECLIACEGEIEAAAGDQSVSVSWTRDRGTGMCRVAIDV